MHQAYPSGKETCHEVLLAHLDRNPRYEREALSVSVDVIPNVHRRDFLPIDTNHAPALGCTGAPAPGIPPPHHAGIEGLPPNRTGAI